MIKVDHVTKYYGRFKAVDDLCFEVGKGEIVGFLGPNGAGKTTTMRIITGFMTPSEGGIFIDGMDIFEEPEKVKAVIGYLPETPPLYPRLTVREYLSFVAELKRVDKSLIKARVDEVLELTGLVERRNTLIDFLSKGLKQRVGIAQSIVNAPAVLILDEPTVGLDPRQVIDIRNLIKRLAKTENRTIILSTHILKEAADICEKAIIINDGRIVAVDTVANLQNTFQTHVRIRVVVARDPGKIASEISRLSGVKDVKAEGNQLEVIAEQDIREKVAEIVVHTGCGLSEMVRLHDTLEDVFVKLVN